MQEVIKKEIDLTWHKMGPVVEEMARREPRESDPHEVVEFSRVVLDWYLNHRGEEGEEIILTAARGVLELRRRQARRKLKAA